MYIIFENKSYYPSLIWDGEDLTEAKEEFEKAKDVFQSNSGLDASELFLAEVIDYSNSRC